jgi:RNA polymerase sigma factor for flagellar operon FliA
MDEQGLWEEYVRTRTMDLRNRLIEEHLALAWRTARKMMRGKPHRVEFDDVYAWGIVGLMQAVENFDPARGIRSFDGYAAQRIKGEILDELRRINWIPRNEQASQNRIEKVRDELKIRLYREPAAEEVIESLGGSEAEARICRTGVARQIQIEEGEKRSEWNLVSDSRAASPLEEAIQRERDATLSNEISVRKFVAENRHNRERIIMYLRYAGNMSLQDIGTLLAVTYERTWQIHREVVNRLKLLGRSRAELQTRAEEYF